MNFFISAFAVSWIFGNFLSFSLSGLISVSPRNSTVREGDNLTIICYQSRNDSNTTSLNFTWSKHGEGISLSNSSRLMLLNVDRKTSENYTCTATNGTVNWVESATVIVIYPPSLITFPSGNLTVNESFPTNLFCNASGNPSPYIQWTLPNGSSVIVRNNELLTFEKTSRSQHGKYSCKAANDVGNSSSAVINLNVQYKPEINKTGLPSNVSSWLYHNSTLTCQAEGNPTPKITWSKDRNELSNGSKSGSIRIYPTIKEDFGNYTCTALNALGKDKIRLDVIRTAFPPDAPKILKGDSELNNRSLTLRWSIPQNNGRPILRYLVFYRELNKNRWNDKDVGKIVNYSFTLDWALSYEFSVAAANDQGQSNKSKVESFTVGPEPTLPAPKLTTTTSGHTTWTVSTPVSSGSSKVGIYGGAAAGVVLLIVVIFVAVYCVKRKRDPAPIQTPLADWTELHSYDPKRIPPRIGSVQNAYNPMSYSRPSKEHGQTKASNLPVKSPTVAVYANLSCLKEEGGWEFPRSKLHIEKYVGKGAFCVVARALAEGLGTVAVKIPKENATESNKKDLLAEYELMKQLQPHPNIICLMGAVTLSDPVMVMFEYIPYGDLLGFLRRSRGLNDNYFKDPDVTPSSSLKSKQLLKFSREIADGMAFLAENKIVHRDLAARNVLVGEEETCKITDFGMARDVQGDDIYQKRTKGRLPVKWTAVEALLYGYYTTKSDVWSYGIVLYEIFTIGGCPYPNISAHRIPYMIKGDYRMPKPAHLDDDIYALMSECWDNEPDRRPTFESISRTIKRLEHCHKEIIYMNVYRDELYDNVEEWDE